MKDRRSAYFFDRILKYEFLLKQPRTKDLGVLMVPGPADGRGFIELRTKEKLGGPMYNTPPPKARPAALLTEFLQLGSDPNYTEHRYSASYHKCDPKNVVKKLSTKKGRGELSGRHRYEKELRQEMGMGVLFRRRVENDKLVLATNSAVRESLTKIQRIYFYGKDSEKRAQLFFNLMPVKLETIELKEEEKEMTKGQLYKQANLIETSEAAQAEADAAQLVAAGGKTKGGPAKAAPATAAATPTKK